MENNCNEHYVSLRTVKLGYIFYLFLIFKKSKGNPKFIIIFFIWLLTQITCNFSIAWIKPFCCLIIMAITLVGAFTASLILSLSFKIVEMMNVPTPCHVLLLLLFIFSSFIAVYDLYFHPRINGLPLNLAASFKLSHARFCADTLHYKVYNKAEIKNKNIYPLWTICAMNGVKIEETRRLMSS